MSRRLMLTFSGVAFFVALIPMACKSTTSRTDRIMTQAIKESSIDVITEITLERGPCHLGNCPIYKISFYKDRPIIYEGQNNVPMVGKYLASDSNCSICYFEQLAKLTDTLGFFDLQERYHENTVDAGFLSLSVVYGGKRKTVVTFDPDPNEGPVELWGLGMAVDGVVTQIKWEKAK